MTLTNLISTVCGRLERIGSRQNTNSFPDLFPLPSIEKASSRRGAMSLRRKPQPFRNKNEYSFSPFRAGQDAWCCHEIRAWDVCRSVVPGSLAGAEAAAGALCGACVSAGAAGHGAKRSVGRRRSGGVEGWTALAGSRTPPKTDTPCERQTASRPCAPQGASMSVNRRFFVRGEALQCPSAGLVA